MFPAKSTLVYFCPGTDGGGRLLGGTEVMLAEDETVPWKSRDRDKKLGQMSTTAGVDDVHGCGKYVR
jgi:hypothetical protein